jgi:hypothetical protein
MLKNRPLFETTSDIHEFGPDINNPIGPNIIKKGTLFNIAEIRYVTPYIHIMIVWFGDIKKTGWIRIPDEFYEDGSPKHWTFRISEFSKIVEDLNIILIHDILEV